MLKEIIQRRLPQRMRQIKCDVCGKIHYTARYNLRGYERVENDINIECCGWRIYGKGYDKELKLCQTSSH